MSTTEATSMVLHDAELPIPVRNSESYVFPSAVIERELREAGLSVEHVGGSAPTIEFWRTGDSVLARYVARRDPATKNGDERKFKVLVLDVLDPRLYCETRDWTKAKVYQGQMIEGVALTEWAQDKANLGSIVKITYFGTIETKKGLAPMRQFTVQKIADV